MPVDKNRRLLVTFPDCFVSSVLGAVLVVTIMSYNFSTGEKQLGSLFKSFVQQHFEISLQEVFFVYSFQLSDTFNLELRILQAEGHMFNGEIFFDFSGVAQQIFIIISIFYPAFFFQIQTCSLCFALSKNASWWVFQSWMLGHYCCRYLLCSIFRTHFPISRFRIHDMF